jgi:hypothetical protein
MFPNTRVPASESDDGADHQIDDQHMTSSNNDDDTTMDGDEYGRVHDSESQFFCEWSSSASSTPDASDHWQEAESESDASDEPPSDSPSWHHNIVLFPHQPNTCIDDVRAQLTRWYDAESVAPTYDGIRRALEALRQRVRSIVGAAGVVRPDGCPMGICLQRAFLPDDIEHARQAHQLWTCMLDACAWAVEDNDPHGSTLLLVSWAREQVDNALYTGECCMCSICSRYIRSLHESFAEESTP